MLANLRSPFLLQREARAVEEEGVGDGGSGIQATGGVAVGCISRRESLWTCL